MTELTNPYLQIKETNLVDNSITEFEYVEYLPRDSNNMNKDGQHIIETKDEDVFLLPHKAYLEIRGKLQTNANANYNNNDVISLVNNGWSLFQTAQYQLTLYYSTVGLLKPTLVTNSNYLNLVRNKNLNFPDFSCLFFPIMMKLFLFIQYKGFKCKMGVFDKFLKFCQFLAFGVKF